MLQKNHIVKSHQVKNVLCEKRIMVEFNHPFTVRLYQTFQDTNRLFMLLELVQGGELWSLLYQAPAEAVPRPTNGLEGISESAARFYTACVTSAFGKIHSLGYVYRDLKPENLLVDKQGYLRVIDFGFTKKIPWVAGGKRHEKSTTLCGTPEYLAPELVLSKGHDRAVDLWALGILIYELIVAETPFADPDNEANVRSSLTNFLSVLYFARYIIILYYYHHLLALTFFSLVSFVQQVFRNIVNSEDRLVFPRRFPTIAKDLIKKLLHPNPALRCGMLRNGMSDVVDHAWFNGELVLCVASAYMYQLHFEFVFPQLLTLLESHRTAHGTHGTHTHTQA